MGKYLSIADLKPKEIKVGSATMRYLNALYGVDDNYFSKTELNKLKEENAELSKRVQALEEQLQSVLKSMRSYRESPNIEEKEIVKLNLDYGRE